MPLYAPLNTEIQTSPPRPKNFRKTRAAGIVVDDELPSAVRGCLAAALGTQETIEDVRIRHDDETGEQPLISSRRRRQQESFEKNENHYTRALFRGRSRKKTPLQKSTRQNLVPTKKLMNDKPRTVSPPRYLGPQPTLSRQDSYSSDSRGPS
eukprot:CAMPEP_0118688498 /NCGR_PEP_ID=MMETSP0800-20121206/8958_1 /TAXON_ID=210618 ORGANISM="Striatella unipunctata, Strain CCMP2910" /NCGR_SAMPLE_ID=MMETSP0800 /ASSEMBLY_ACC=CAM_ASM_000638 /LENGTH=151 /DNA_ID=CAMNT_0006585773 /DNA_START=174 /DNA_END=625 /DNA_ORIENTATION=-